jgi:hypothetical protein
MVALNLLSRARAVAKVVRARVQETEVNRRIAEDVIERMREQRDQGCPTKDLRDWIENVLAGSICAKYANYYNTARMHGALAKDAPVSRPVQRVGRIVWHAMAGGLHHQYVRI